MVDRLNCRVAVLVAGAMMGASGCEKLPWFSPPGGSPHSGPAASSQPPQTTSGMVLPAPPVVSPTDVLAKVNGRIISRREGELALGELRVQTEAAAAVRGDTTWKWTPLSAEDLPDQYDLHDLLNDLVIAELRAQDAVARGLERNSEVQYRFQHRQRNFFAQEWLAWQVNRLTVTPAEVEQFYKENQWGFREPKRIRIRQLVLPAEEQAKAALVKLYEGVDIVEVARQMRTLRPEAAEGALVEQWVLRSADKAAFAPNDETVRDLRDRVLEDAAFAIDNERNFSSYVKGGDGNFHIFQLLEQKKEQTRTLEEVFDSIQNFLRLQKLAELTQELRKNAQVESFPDRLSGVQQ